MKPQIIHHQRLPYEGQVSIERLFSELRNYLRHGYQLAVATSPKPSKGLMPRITNLRTARREEAEVHHIVGDVHYLAFGLPGNRLVLTIHDCAALNRLKGWRREVMRQLWFVQPMRRAAAVTTISASAKEELRKWVGGLAERVEVIPNCVRSEFVVVPKVFNEVRPVVLQVGTGWNKNVERVAEALSGTPCVLEIVGQLSDAQRASLVASGVSFHELGRISDEELVQAYRRCEILVFASLYEGFGLPILEAQATGRVVITSNRSSMPEAAGEGALLVDPESIKSIRDAVQLILNDTEIRAELVEKGIQNVKKFRPEIVATQYAKVYERVVAGLTQ